MLHCVGMDACLSGAATGLGSFSLHGNKAQTAWWQGRHTRELQAHTSCQPESAV